MVDTKEAILTRHATRLFNKKRKITANTVKRIIHLAQYAPSWVDSQPWKVYVAMGNTLKKVQEVHQKNVDNEKKASPDWSTTHRKDWADFPRNNMAKHNECTTTFWQNEALKNYKRSQLQEILYDAPVICYLTIPKDSNQWSDYDLGAFGQTLMLAAKGMGIDSMPAYEIVKYPDSVREIMHIPDNEWIAMGIALGYGDIKTGINDYRAPRVAIDDMLKIED